MKSTRELYLIDASTLRELPYEEALERKIAGAERAKQHYRELAQKEILFSTAYYKQHDKYKASIKARNHTQKLLAELEL